MEFRNDQRNLKRAGELFRCIVCGADIAGDRNHKCPDHDYPRKNRTRKQGHTVSQRIGFGFFLMGLDGSEN